MKYKYSILIIFLFLVISAFAQDYKGKVIVTDKKPDKENNSLSLSMDIVVRPGTLERCQSLVIVPGVEKDGNLEYFPYILVNGQNQDRMFTRWLRLRSNDWNYTDPYLRAATGNDADTLIHYQASVTYQPWMETAKLYVYCELYSCNDDALSFTLSEDNLDFRPAVPYQVQPLVTFAEPAREVKFRNVQSQAFLDFQAGKSVIMPGFRNNPAELKKLEDMIGMIRKHEGTDEVNITGLFIEGYASPDGPYALNERLSRERTVALKDYIKMLYNFPDNMLKTNSVAEDWEGLARLTGESGTRYSDDILAIINNTSDPDLREKKIRELGGGAAYRDLSADILPRLRRVESRVDFSVRDYSDDEVKVRYSKGENLEWMSQFELWRLASGYGKDSGEFGEIMDLAVRLFPDDATANINAGAVMITRGDLASAARLLEKAKDDPRAWNNLGVVQLQNGNLDSAEELFRKAARNGSDQAKHNLAETQKKRDDNNKQK